MAGVNIKSLPETSQINLDDFLILETQSGTQVIRFNNFTVDKTNTTFEPLLSGHTSDITDLTTKNKTISSDVVTLSGLWDYNEAATGNFIHSLSSVTLGDTLNTERLTVHGNISASGSLSAAGGGYNYFENRVGIGTTTPARELHILNTDGRIRVEATAGNHPGYELAEDSARKWIIFNRPSTDAQGTTDQLVFKTNTDERMVLQESGRVGIGTTTPHTMLYVGNSGSFGMATTTEHPVSPVASQEAFMYIKADKLIIKYNDAAAGEVRYKYFPLSGTDVSWLTTTDSSIL